MSLRKLALAPCLCASLLIPSTLTAQQPAGDPVDLNALTAIKREAFNRSQVMETLYTLSEVYGPRVNNSRNHRAAAEWAMTQMRAWGLQNVHLEKWGPFGNGWQIKKFYGALETPAYAALIGFPLAWTPGTNGPVTGEPILAPIRGPEDFSRWHGKLRGKIVLLAEPKVLEMHTTPEAHRLTEEEIHERAETPDPARLNRGPRAAAPPSPAQAFSTAAPSGMILRNQINKFLKEEGVLVAVNYGYNGDGGTVFATYGGSQNPGDPVPPPMVAITPEHYNRIARLLQHGVTPKLTFDIQTEFQTADQMGFNVIGELPGTTKKDEVVMLGGHFDSWQGGTGATDNGTGSSVALEAMRILASLHQSTLR